MEQEDVFAQAMKKNAAMMLLDVRIKTELGIPKTTSAYLYSFYKALKDAGFSSEESMKLLCSIASGTGGQAAQG